MSEVKTTLLAFSGVGWKVHQVSDTWISLTAKDAYYKDAVMMTILNGFNSLFTSNPLHKHQLKANAGKQKFNYSIEIHLHDTNSAGTRLIVKASWVQSHSYYGQFLQNSWQEHEPIKKVRKFIIEKLNADEVFTS